MPRGLASAPKWGLDPGACQATLLTGRRPSRHGVGTGVVAEDPLGLPDDEWTLPERLKRANAGIACIAIGKWHLGTHGHGGPMSPLHNGFDHHAGSLASLLDTWSLDGAPQDCFDWEKATDGVVARTDTYATTDDTLAALDGLPEPWFGGFAVFDNRVHTPPQVSRAVAYEVDEAAGSYRQVWAFPEPNGGFTGRLGDVRALESGHYLTAWGGLGALREITAEGEVVWHVQARVNIGRVRWLPDLYALP